MTVIKRSINGCCMCFNLQLSQLNIVNRTANISAEFCVGLLQVPRLLPPKSAECYHLTSVCRFAEFLELGESQRLSDTSFAVPRNVGRERYLLLKIRFTLKDVANNRPTQ